MLPYGCVILLTRTSYRGSELSAPLTQVPAGFLKSVFHPRGSFGRPGSLWDHLFFTLPTPERLYLAYLETITYIISVFENLNKSRFKNRCYTKIKINIKTQ